MTGYRIAQYLVGKDRAGAVALPLLVVGIGQDVECRVGFQMGRKRHRLVATVQHPAHGLCMGVGLATHLGPKKLIGRTDKLKIATVPAQPGARLDARQDVEQRLILTAQHVALAAHLAHRLAQASARIFDVLKQGTTEPLLECVQPQGQIQLEHRSSRLGSMAPTSGH